MKTFGADGALDEVRNLTDVAAPAGVADIDLSAVLQFHRSHHKLATVTVV